MDYYCFASSYSFTSSIATTATTSFVVTVGSFAFGSFPWSFALPMGSSFPLIVAAVASSSFFTVTAFDSFTSYSNLAFPFAIKTLD